MSAPDDDREKRLLIAKQLLDVFKFERMAYITATLLAVIMLLVFAIVLLFRESYVMALGMFGASGVIGYSIGQLLKMWNQVFTLIFGPGSEGKP
jgi:membrane-bound ClpP family serine protease